MDAKYFLSFLTLALASCSSTPPLQNVMADTSVIRQQEMPTPTGADLLTANRPYLIGPFDKLKVDVFGIADLEREVQTDASGNFLFPLIGLVEAGGKTPSELAVSIESRLRGQFVRNPQVTINLEETTSQVVTIEGQVRKPGLYPVVGRMTLLRTIAVAEGTSEFADLTDVVVFRTANGQKFAGLYNLKAIRDGTYEDPEIFANDVVVVGDSPGRRLFKDLIQVAPALVTPLIILLQQ
ncbi:MULTISPECIES: polysaccharide biosynthesis/export family protein [unclassified Microcoleus]|uniref:polysaccharide biosynthesis/export family protein n=1 Tax=unclassified Microcoleus TaxID=2642155 RepID=UPI002FCF9F6C